MNEVLLSPKYNYQPEKQTIYFGEIAELASELEALTRKEDPTRYTMIPNHGDFARYNKVGLTKIPMLVGWNLYQGWYGPDMTGFAAFLDQHHKELPNKPLLVTEYGADADIRLRSFEPERFDITVDYANRYHRYYLQEMMKRPFVAAAMAWNFADFNSEGRADVVPHVNTKGIVTIDRKPKDVYFLYQAFLATKPYIKIASSNWILRSGIADDDTKNYCTQPLEVYSNGTRVTVYLDNVKLNEREVTDHITTFNIPFHDGINQLEVISSSKDGTIIKDFASVEFLLLGHSLDNNQIPFKEINISVGDQRYFIDEPLHQVWLPDQIYQKGSYGYVDGDVFIKKGGQHRYGTDKNILGTTYDPIYQTQRVGLAKYKIDVPRGSYEVTLHFAELLSEGVQQALAYSLNDKAVKEEVATRIFDITINDQLTLQNINNVQHLKSATAYKEKVFVTVKADEGIEIAFIAKQGQAILNGVQVRKIY
jgi:beta-galactosidase